MPKKPRKATINTRHPLSRGLVGYWLLNEHGGNVAWDTFGKRHNGSLTGMDPSVAWVPSSGGGSLKFDGTDDYVQCGTLLSNVLQNSYSVYARVRFATDAGIQPLVSLNVSGSSGNGPINLAARYGQLTFRVNDSAFGYAEATVPAFSVNTWYDIIGTRNGNTLRLFLNTVPGTDSTTAIPAFGSVTQQLRFGNNAYESSTWFSGEIERVSIWQRALSDGEVVMLSSCRDANILEQSINLISMASSVSTATTSFPFWPNPMVHMLVR